MDSAPTLEAAMAAVYELYRSLKPVAATRNILLPVGTDYTPPNKWVTEIHRAWNARYVWPRFVCGTPRDFLDAVRTEISALSPQSRDMNPIYTGKDVSYIDTKQAQRAAEVAALDAERLSALAALLGLGRYPHTALDKVWRQLAYGAHHDAITGSESDQVYIDLLTGWREAYDLAADARDRALDALMGQVAVDGRSVVVTNTLPFARDGLVRVRLGPGLRVADPAGVEIPAVSEHGTLTFTARDVPATGWRTYRIVEGRADPWQDLPGTTIENERWRIVADPARGGALASVTDLATGRELLTGLGNELRLYEEYPQHPDMGEGPWHLMPTGSSLGSGDAPRGFRTGRDLPRRAADHRHRAGGRGRVRAGRHPPGGLRPGGPHHPRGRLHRRRPPAQGPVPGTRRGRAAGVGRGGRRRGARLRAAGRGLRRTPVDARQPGQHLVRPVLHRPGGPRPGRRAGDRRGRDRGARPFGRASGPRARRGAGPGGRHRHHLHRLGHPVRVAARGLEPAGHAHRPRRAGHQPGRRRAAVPLRPGLLRGAHVGRAARVGARRTAAGRGVAAQRGPARPAFPARPHRRRAGGRAGGRPG
ncbi:hypothetical protein ACFSTC_50735 [Nonomuraea ferruginea]